MINLNIPHKMPKKVLSYYLLNFVVLIIFFLILLSILNALEVGAILIPGLIFFVFIPAFFVLYLHYLNFSFIVKEDGIAIKSGILVKRSKLIPSNSIQNIELRSGILMRFLTKINSDFITSSNKTRNKIHNIHLIVLLFSLQRCYLLQESCQNMSKFEITFLMIQCKNN